MRVPKILIAFTFLIITQSLSVHGQWLPQSASSGPIYYNAGHVGIGTATPPAPLTVSTSETVMSVFQNPGVGNSWISVMNNTGYMNLGIGASTPHPYVWSNTDNFFIGSDGNPTLFVKGMANGNVGIGTTTPQAMLDVAGTGKMNYLDINNGSADGGRVIFRSQGNGEWRVRNFLGSLGFFPGEGNPTSLWLQSDGNVGIGTICAHAKLAVDGNILAKKVTVTVNGWCDYVFNKDYKLPSLTELEQYIQQNHHLPEVPSTEEVKKDGLDLGDNQATLLKRIEELTLYVIELNNKLQQQTKDQRQLQLQVEQLQEEKGRLNKSLKNHTPTKNN